MKKENALKTLAKDKQLFKMVLAVFCSGIAYLFYCLIFQALGYVYAEYPDQKDFASLMVTLPGIMACVGGYLSAVALRKFSAKSVMIFAYVVTIAGGLAVFFFGRVSLPICVVAITMTGLTAGIIPPAQYTCLAKISTPNLRDKIVGWSGIISALGHTCLNMWAGVSAASGHWTNTFIPTFALIPILILTVVWFPSQKKINEMQERNAKYFAEEDAPVKKVEEEKSYMPKSIIALIGMTFVVCLFYMALHLNASDFIINEAKIGTSTLAASCGSAVTIITMLVSAALFVFLRKFKGFTASICLAIQGICMLLVVNFPSVPVFVIGYVVNGVILGAFIKCIYTMCAMGPKGKAVGTANGLINGTIYLGEAVCVYVCPWIATAVFHSSQPSAAITVGAIACFVLALIVYPVYRSAYKVTFGKDDEEEKKQKV